MELGRHSREPSLELDVEDSRHRERARQQEVTSCVGNSSLNRTTKGIIVRGVETEVELGFFRLHSVLMFKVGLSECGFNKQGGAEYLAKNSV